MLYSKLKKVIFLIIIISFIAPINAFGVEKLSSFIKAKAEYNESARNLSEKESERERRRNILKRGRSTGSLTRDQIDKLEDDARDANDKLKTARYEQIKAKRKLKDKDKTEDIALEAILSTENSTTAAQYKFISGDLIKKLIGKAFDGKEKKNNPCNEDKKHSKPVWASNWTPNFDVNAGANDAFDSLVFNFTGDYVSVTCKPKKDADKREIVIEPNWDITKAIYAIQISGGVETNQKFNNANFLAEIGFVPIMNIPLVDDYFLKLVNLGGLVKYIGFEEFELGETVEMGIFLQAGYKQKLSTVNPTDSNSTGGAADESKENPDTEIFRLKVHTWPAPRKLIQLLC